MANPGVSSSTPLLVAMLAWLGLFLANARAAEEPETNQPSIAAARAELVRLGARLEFDRNANVDVVEMTEPKNTDQIMRLVSQLSHVRCLTLLDSDITDQGLVEIGKLQHLESLSLDSRAVTDAGLQHLLPLRNLTELDLAGTNVGSVPWDTRGQLAKLQALFREGARVANQSASPLAKMTTLKSLNLYCTGFVDADMASLEPLVNLEILFLPKSISDQGMVHLKPLRNLRQLYLAKTRVTDQGLTYLADHDKLEYLTLYGTLVTDAGVEELAKLKALNEVVLARTQTTRAGIETLRRACPGIDIQWRD